MAEPEKKETEVKEEQSKPEIVDPTKIKGKAPNSTAREVKKGRKRLSGAAKASIVIAIIAIVVVLIVVGINAGWYDFILKKQNSITMPALTDIQVQEDLQDVDDDTLEYQIESILSSNSTEEDVKGKIKDGDTVNIDYEGVLVGETEPFDGGSAEGYDLTIGSGSFIDGFEDGLIGHKAGETVELNLTFPDEYSDEDLAGKDVVFTVTINSVTRTVEPELTDEWVQEYSKDHCDKELSTVDEFKDYVKQDLIDDYINEAIMEYIEPRATVNSYGEVQETAIKEYVSEQFEYQAEQYGYDADSLAALYGYDSEDAYVEDQAHIMQKEMMIVDEICKQKNITVSDADVDAAIEKYMKENSLEDSYTVDQLKETAGETWVEVFTELQVKYQKAMEALHDNVIYVEEVETVSTTTEETSAEESSDESTDESDTSSEDESADTSETDAETDVETTAAE